MPAEAKLPLFDDMVNRNVPCYDEIQWMQAELVVSLLADGQQRGCALGFCTGTTIAAIGTHPGNHEQVRFVTSTIRVTFWTCLARN